MAPTTRCHPPSCQFGLIGQLRVWRRALRFRPGGNPERNEAQGRPGEGEGEWGERPFVYLPIYLSGAGIVLLGFGRLCVLNNGLGTNSLGSTRVPTLESLPSLPPAPALSAALAGIEIAGQNGEK